LKFICLRPIARKNIEDAALANRVNVLSGSALKIVPKLHENFDMVFLDAAKEEYLRLVVADNVGIFEKSMNDYLEYVRKSGRYTQADPYRQNWSSMRA